MTTAPKPPPGSTDWMWCFENPKDAAMEIDRRRSVNAALVNILKKARRKLGGTNIMGEQLNAALIANIDAALTRAKE